MTEPKPRISEENAFALTAFAAIVFHFLVARAYPTLCWPDEIFQTLEQGHRWAFGYGVTPWEFRDGVRSWALPGMLGAVMKATAFLGPGSTGYLLGVRFFLAACSVTPVVVAMAWARREKLRDPWVAGLATAVWFELVFFSTKALTEVFAAYALCVALYFCTGTAERRAMLWAGVAWGVAIGFRVHLATAAAVAIVWTCRKDLARWKQLVPGFVAAVLAFGLLDWATWSYPFQSLFLNVWVNVMEGKAASFGVSPPWDYLRGQAIVWSWGALPLLALVVLASRRWPLLGITALVILVTHSLIGHKEYRFLVPFLATLVLAASLELTRLLEANRDYGLAACALYLAATADGARRYDLKELPQRINDSVPYPMWTQHPGELRAYEYLSTSRELCGIASIGLGWGWTGGYTYLHQDVPMFDVRTKTEMEKYRKHFNFVIATPENGDTLTEFKREECFGLMCVYRRPGACEPPGDYSINAYLAATGM